MKKIFILIPLVGMFWSCKRQTQVLPSKTVETVKTSKLKVFSAVDGKYDLLGYGYNVTGVFGNSNSSMAQVIDVSKLDLNYPGRVITNLNKTQNYVVSTGDNALTYASDLSAHIKATATLALWNATIDASYSDAGSHSSKYIYASYSLMIQQKALKLNADLPTLKQCLTPAFLYDIQNSPPNYIVSHYGTHILANIILGAKLQLMYQSQTTSSDRKTSSKAGLQVSVGKVFNLDAGFNLNQSSTASNFSQTLHYITYGGDPTKSLVGQVAISQTTPTINIADWQSSSTVQNAELIDIDPDGLIAIYDLIPDATKAAAVKTYITQYLTNNQITLLPAPVYEYYNSRLGKHAYNLNPNMNTIFPDYGSNGQPFQAFTFSYLGAVPVYQFYNPKSSDHVLTTNSAPGWAGYNYDGIIFYAYTSNVAGTVPLYEFYYPKSADHFYSTNRNAAASFPGWTYNGQPFYVNPN